MISYEKRYKSSQGAKDKEWRGAIEEDEEDEEL
jgi:hypothetical protein